MGDSLDIDALSLVSALTKGRIWIKAHYVVRTLAAKRVIVA